MVLRSQPLLAGLVTMFALSPAVPAQVVEEIIVTAQKREESVQDVPIAMQAFTGDQIRTMRVSEASDITRLAPNLNLSTQNTASQQINIRGVGTSDFFGNSSGSVGVYMDEVTMSASYLSSLGLYDMERVEILRGPQNTLFGRNTTGGAINYISRMPEVSGDSDGYVDLTYGNYNRIEVEAAGSLSLTDTVAVRIAGKSYNRDGIWNNLGDGGAEHGDKDHKSIRGTLVWEPSDATSVIGNIHFAKQDDDFDPIRAVGLRTGPGIPATPAEVSGQIDFTRTFNSSNSQGNNPSTGRWEDVYVTGTYIHDVETTGGFLKINHDFDRATFTSITSYDVTDVLWTYDTGGIGNNTPTTVSLINQAVGFNGGATPQVTLAIDQDQYYEQFSQELRLTSSDQGKLRWIVGAYYFHEDAELMQNIRFGEFSPPPVNAAAGIGAPLGGSLGLLSLANLALCGRVPGAPCPVATDNLGITVPGAMPVGYGNRLAFQYAELDNDVSSLYGQTNYDITDSLQFTFGLRYTRDVKELPVDIVGNQSTAGDPITTVYDRELVLARASAITTDCDLDGDGNLNVAGNTLDSRGQICTDFPARDKIEDNEWGGKVGLDWHVSDDIMLYGSYSRGFRSGKHDIEFLHGSHTGFSLLDLEAETLDAYEIGMKSDLLDGSLQFNLSTYFYTWNNQQTLFVDPTTGPVFVNIPESELKGFEAELRWAPADGWFFVVGLGLQDTEILESSDTRFVQVGHELPFAADTSANLLGSKEFTIGAGVLTLQADWQYRSAPKAYARDIALVDELEEVSKVNARVNYVFGPQQRYEIAVFGENLTENETCAYKWDLFAFSGTTYCVANEATAFYGVQGRWNF